MAREHMRMGGAAVAGAAGGAAEGLDRRTMAMMQRAHDRKQGKSSATSESNSQTSPAIAEARAWLKEKFGTDLRSTIYGALDEFQSMVRADERHDLEVSIGFGKVAGAKVSEWLEEKALHLAKESFEMGESVVGEAIAPVFGAAKGRLESVAETGDKITALAAVDHIVAEARRTVDHVVVVAERAIGQLSDEKLAAVAGVQELLNGVQDASDSEREGTLRHGLQNWILERMGAPKTGGVAMHDHAVELYEVYRAEVRQALPVRDQVNEMKEATDGSLHRHAEDEATSAEKRLGMDGEVERDTMERQRVENLK